MEKQQTTTNNQKECCFVSPEIICEKIKQLRQQEFSDNTDKTEQTKVETEQTDAILLFAAERTIEMVSAYCNIKNVPLDLKNVCVDIAMTLYDNENYTQKQCDIKTIQEGNVSISYQKAKNSWNENKQTLLQNFSQELDRFRKLNW